MKQATLILLIVFVSLTAYCQKNISLKFSPLALIDDVSFPTIQAGIDYRFSDRFSWYNEAGVKYRRSMYDKYWDTSFATSKGFKIKTELRYYLSEAPFSFFGKRKKFQKPSGSYLAFNLFYSSDIKNNGVDYYYRRDSTTQRTDVFDVNKKIFGFNFLVGKERSLGEHLSFDLYLGGGVRFRNIKTNHQEYDPWLDGWITPIDLNVHTIFTEAEVKQKKDATGNLSCGIRVAYKL
jgi:hypothetical protein